MAESAEPRSFRGKLNRTLILKEALRFIDSEGAQRLSMRELAAKLGVEAMSLYRHVKNKEDILAGVVDLVYREIKPLDADIVGWREALREGALRERKVFLKHPAVGEFALLYSRRSPAGRALIESRLHIIEQAGLSGEDAYHSYHLLGSFLLGTKLQDALLLQYARQVARSIHELSAEEVPVSTRYAKFLLGHNREREFEYGLDVILDSIERQRSAVEAGTRRNGRTQVTNIDSKRGSKSNA